MPEIATNKPENAALTARLNAQQLTVLSWIEDLTGGRVVRFDRHGRWRPMYFVDVEKDSETLPLMVRHARHDVPLAFPLKHEMTAQNLLYEHGIPVPKVYGWHDDPECFLMERLPGSPRFAKKDETTRDKVTREYIKVLVDIHNLPTEPFKRAGVVCADSPQESHLIGLRRFDHVYRSIKNRPNAFIEFALAWLKRHPIAPPARETVTTWDSGQFHQHNGQLAGLVDLELAHVGDPMMDLGCLRMRDTVVDFGDLEKLYTYYEELSGMPLDRDAMHFHHLFFALCNALCQDALLGDPPPHSNYMIYLQWTNETNRYTLEAIAEDLGLELPEIEIPEPEDSPMQGAFELLISHFRDAKIDDPYLQYEMRNGFRLARHLARWDEIGRQLIEADLEDIAELLGRRPPGWREGEAELENFVLTDDGRHDSELVLLFNRKLQRAQALNGPAGSAMATHLKLQPLIR